MPILTITDQSVSKSMHDEPTSAAPAMADAGGAADGAARQRRKEARPQELLAAALTLFVEKGFAATRTEEVARLAGVSKGTLFLYYPSKDELFKSVVRHNLTSLIEEGEQLAACFEGSSSELLGLLIQTWWERFGNTPAAGIHKVILAEVRNFPELAQFYADEVMVPAERLFGGCVERGVARGEFRPLPTHEVSLALIAPLIFMAVHRHSVGCCPVHGTALMDPERLLRTQLELVLRGLQVRPDDRPKQAASKASRKAVVKPRA
jgi:AcrR family transcriptional regulator